MRFVRYAFKKKLAWGVLQGDRIREISEGPFKRSRLGNGFLELRQVRLLAPATPGKIVLVGLNYRNHARELGMRLPRQPIIFLKPPTAIVGPDDAVIYPQKVKRLDYEAELALVIKKSARNVAVRNALDYVLGFTCLNDITARDIQKKEGQWTRAKSFDSFCPLGPVLRTDLDPSDLKIRSYVNGRLKQDSSTRNLIFSVPELISFISGVMTLLPGDVISTGTPPGIGRLRPGDRVSVEIEGIGRLDNSVIKEDLKTG